MSTTPSEPTDRWVRRLLEETAGDGRALERTWDALELPPPAEVPPGYAARVAANARAASARGVGPFRAVGGPGLPRWAAAGALLLGIAMGSVVAYELQDAVDSAADEATLAESYLAAASLESLADAGSALVGETGPADGEEAPR